MTPAERQLLEDLRAAIAKKIDPAERKELEDKLAFVERGFASESLQTNSAESEALLAKARRAVFWGRLGPSTFVVALLAALAWFWGRALL